METSLYTMYQKETNDEATRSGAELRLSTRKQSARCNGVDALWPASPPIIDGLRKCGKHFFLEICL